MIFILDELLIFNFPEVHGVISPIVQAWRFYKEGCHFKFKAGDESSHHSNNGTKKPRLLMALC